MQHTYLSLRLSVELEILTEFALDLRWTWTHASDALWQVIDTVIGKRTQNPWVILQNVSKDQAFLNKLED